MSDKNLIKQQRDRFLAFSFASSDLFLETNAKGKIIFALGAAKCMTGVEDDDLIGRNWLTLFEKIDHSKLIKMEQKAQPAMRCGPVLVALQDNPTHKKGIVTAIKMPGSSHLYVTLALSSTLMDRLAKLMTEETTEAITTGFKATDEKTEPVTTGFEAEDEQEPEATTTDFDPTPPEDPESFTTGFEASDEPETEAATTGFDPGAEEEPEDYTTGYDPGIEEEPESFTTGYEPPPEQEAEDYTTGYDPSIEKEPESFTTSYDPGTEKEPKSTTTGFDPTAKDDEVETMVTGFTATDDDEDECHYTKQEFISESTKAFELARENNIEAALTVFDFGRSSTVPQEKWAEMVGEVAKFLREQSLDGKSAAELDNGKYGLLHDETIDSEIIEEKISAISKEIDPEGEGIDVSSTTLNAALDSLSNEEATRALFYTINEFEKDDKEITVENLDDGFKTYVSANAQRLQEFKNIIERVDFDVHFQPIIHLETKQAKHYEVLSRFHAGNTQEWMMFGEDVGLSADYDVAVVERTMNFIHYKAGTTRTKFSINISDRSLENETFLERLQDQLARRDLKNRIMFEITESSRIKDIKKIAQFVREMQSDGYEIALDDFGAESATFEYLQHLNVNYIKIDGKYTRRILTSSESEIMIRNLVKMCKDLGTKTIAEFVEEKEQEEMLIDMDIDFAQGHLYGEIKPRPDYIPPVT